MDGLSIEGMSQVAHFIEHASKGPHITLVTVVLSLEKLRWHVVWSSNASVSKVFRTVQNLCDTEISQSYLTLCIYFVVMLEYLNFILSNISCCRLLRESKNPIKMQMITTQYKLRMNLFTTKSKKPMTGQNIPTNKRRNTPNFWIIFGWILKVNFNQNLTDNMNIFRQGSSNL